MEEIYSAYKVDKLNNDHLFIDTYKSNNIQNWRELWDGEW